MLDRAKLTRMLKLMYRIRYFEENLKNLYNYTAYFKKSDIAADDYDFQSTGVVGGACHLYIGEEAVAVGVCANLNDDDCITSTHRGHGHAIAKGADLKPMLAELMGRKDGYCYGCGGSMHIFIKELGLLGGNGIIGAGLPIATGAAFSAKYRGTKQVAVCFFGDGGVNQGTFNESLNMAALWKLPVLYVVENNLMAASTPAEIAHSTPDLARRADGYGVPGKIVDGQDVMAVYDAAAEAVARARQGEGPTLLECKTFRFEAHCGVTRDNKRQHENPALRDQWAKRDPITLFEQRLVRDGVMTEADQSAMKAAAIAEVQEAEAFAKASPFPTMEQVEARL